MAERARATPRIDPPPRSRRSPLLHESGPALRALGRELSRIDAHLCQVEARLAPVLALAQPDWRESACNLVHYVALRQLDLRELQLLLQQHGFSSLGRSESFVMASLLEVRLRLAEALLARGDANADEVTAVADRRRTALPWQTAKFLLHAHTHAAFGAKPSGRHVHVMVTAPAAAEADARWLARMLRAGMNVLRINCAHEGPSDWSRILAALVHARRETGLDCRVLMDLGGPKIRTGRVAEGRRIATWKVQKDELGRVRQAAQIAIRPRSRAAEPADAPLLVLDDPWFATLRRGDVLRLRDTRNRKRTLTVRRVGTAEVTAETPKRAYVTETTRLVHVRGGRILRKGHAGLAGVKPAGIPLAVGERLVLTADDVEGRPAERDARGHVRRPAVVSCTVPEALSRVAAGHRVLFDDGRIEAEVERVHGADLRLRVRRTSRPVVRLRAEKGINLPDSPLPIGALTVEDHAALAFVAEHADLVGLSFVRAPEDVAALHAALGERQIGIVLKIETRAGFERLPRILLEAMRRPPVAVMIARGDLAVEMGFERLAEVQEEILWLCEAAHVPAIWATQVLDSLARTGVPSRAEVTDAAASVAAECVMLNKGPHVEEAVLTLVDILQRMERHHYKKRSIFRKLRVSALDAM